jgi:hypothetical protein
MQCSFLSLLGDLKRHLLRLNPVWARMAVIVLQTIHHMRTHMSDGDEGGSRQDGEHLSRIARGVTIG